MKLILSKISKAQVLSGLAFLGAQLVAWGAVSDHTEKLSLSVAGVVLPGVWMVADAVIHHAWAKVRVAELEADAEKLLALLHHSDPRVAGAAVAAVSAQVLPAGLPEPQVAPAASSAKKK